MCSLIMLKLLTISCKHTNQKSGPEGCSPHEGIKVSLGGNFKQAAEWTHLFYILKEMCVCSSKPCCQDDHFFLEYCSDTLDPSLCGMFPQVLLSSTLNVWSKGSRLDHSTSNQLNWIGITKSFLHIIGLLAY